MDGLATEENSDALLRSLTHQQARQFAQDVLQKARNDPRRWKGKTSYDSLLIRTKMRESFEADSELVAKPWQMDTGEALYLGLDVTGIAATGSGKTVSCALPMLAPGNEKRIGLIIAPLLSLEADHVCSIFFLCCLSDSWLSGEEI